MYDTISFEDFEALFPAKIRGNPRIQTMYTAIAAKRNTIRTTVKRNIERHCRQESAAAGGRGQFGVGGSKGTTIEQATLALKQRSQDLEASIAEVEAECDEIKSGIASFKQSLTHGELQQLIPHGLDLENTTALLQTMGGD